MVKAQNGERQARFAFGLSTVFCYRRSLLTGLSFAALLIAGLAGCGGQSQQPAASGNRPTLAPGGGANDSQRPVAARQTPVHSSPRDPANDPPAWPLGGTQGVGQQPVDSLPGDPLPVDPLPVGPRPRPPQEDPSRSLADLLNQPTVFKPMAIDEARTAAAGIRKLAGKHLMLYTDLPSSPEVDELPHVFDLAVPQWCAYFEIDPAKKPDWRMTAFVMAGKERFQEAGLLPDFLPPFQNGFTHGLELWVFEQPSAYYRRHLVLHEGTHAFMEQWLGHIGPPWYAEGMAELLATHRWQQGKLELNFMPRDKAEVPQWGRIKIIKDGAAAGTAPLLENVMLFGPDAHLQVEPYGWCWGAAAMLDREPNFRPAFRQLRSHVGDAPDVFRNRCIKLLGDEWDHACEEWQLFVAEADYGYDFARAAVERKPAAPLGQAATVAVAVDRGWQSSGLRVEPGIAYRLEATGRYQVGDQPRIWWCEANGVTIQYHRGMPLGMLQCAVRDEAQPLTGRTLSPLVAPQGVGYVREITFDHGGTLYFRINESPAALADNKGSLSVKVSRK